MPAEPAPVPLASFPKPRAIAAALRPRLPDYLPARMLNEFVYCPRLFHYEWVEGVFAHNADTVEGALRHASVDGPAGGLPKVDEATGAPIHSRSVTLSSESHRLIAVLDLVEGEGGRVSPVDYKKGEPCDGDDGLGAWPADRAQVCAQALILRDQGYACDEAVVYYSATRQRVRVAIDEALVAETLAAVEAARRVAESGRIPAPLVDSPKCVRCSLVSICLPDETAAVASATEGDIVQPSLFDDGGDGAPVAEAGAGEVRRLVPARDDLRPLYVTGHGLTLGKKDERLQVRDGKKVVQEVRLGETSQVNLMGAVHITSPVVHALCEAEKPIAHFSSGGWFYGLTQGLGLKNVFLRRAQVLRAEDADFCLWLARQLVATKIRNQRTLLQRNHVEPPARAIALLKRLAERAGLAEGLEELLGVEGSAARVYFEQFAGMIKVDEEARLEAFDFRHRNRRPPRDPVNALLSLGYAMLARDLTVVCAAIGFDPFVGYFHQPRFGRPALALDLMEGFRPLVVDSAVLTAVNGRMIQADHFVRAGGSVGLMPAGRKAFIRAYEQRMDVLVTHPLFGYRVGYRRVLEIQARLLARLLTGELASYPGFETR